MAQSDMAIKHPFLEDKVFGSSGLVNVGLATGGLCEEDVGGSSRRGVVSTPLQQISIAKSRTSYELWPNMYAYMCVYIERDTSLRCRKHGNYRHTKSPQTPRA